MKKLITNLRMLKLALTAVVAGLALTSANAQSPWCDGGHYYQNSGYSATAYITALEQVRIRNGSTILFNVPGDGYSGNGSTCGSEYRLAGARTFRER